MKKLSLVLAFLLALTGCSGAGNGNDKKAEEKSPKQESADSSSSENGEIKDTLIMGMDDTFAPMGFRDEDGNLVGFDVDLSQAVAEKMGVKIDYQPIEWSMKETELQAGNIDLIWNGYSITDERKDQVAFSDPYLDNAQIIVTKKDSDINSKADLAGKTVTTQAESSTIDAFDREPEVRDSFKDLAEYATFTECFNDLDSGRSQALVGDKVLVLYTMREKEDQYKVLDEDFGTEEFAVGMRKEDTALKEAINKALKELKEDGTYDEIYDKWFTE